MLFSRQVLLSHHLSLTGTLLAVLFPYFQCPVGNLPKVLLLLSCLSLLGLFCQTLRTFVLFLGCLYFFYHKSLCYHRAYCRFLCFIRHLLGSIVVCNQNCRIFLSLLPPTWYNTAINFSILLCHLTKLLPQKNVAFFHRSLCICLFSCVMLVFVPACARVLL